MVNDDLEILRDFLRDCRFPTTQRKITEETGVTGVRVRAVCQHYPAQFVSSTEGYLFIENASKIEVQECVTNLIHRSTKMLERAAALSLTLTYKK